APDRILALGRGRRSETAKHQQTAFPIRHDLAERHLDAEEFARVENPVPAFARSVDRPRPWIDDQPIPLIGRLVALDIRITQFFPLLAFAARDELVPGSLLVDEVDGPFDLRSGEADFFGSGAFRRLDGKLAENIPALVISVDAEPGGLALHASFRVLVTTFRRRCVERNFRADETVLRNLIARAVADTGNADTGMYPAMFDL